MLPILLRLARVVKMFIGSYSGSWGGGKRASRVRRKEQSEDVLKATVSLGREERCHKRWQQADRESRQPSRLGHCPLFPERVLYESLEATV